MTAQLDARAAQHSQRARVYGGDYAFGTVVKEDAETIRSVLEESAKGRTGADEVAFLGPDFSLRASSGRHIGALAPRARSLAASDGGDGNSSEIMMLAGEPHRVVIAPVKQAQGELQGWLLMSFSFEPRLIADMRALSKQQFSLLVRDGPKEPWLTRDDLRRFKWMRECEREFQPFHQRNYFAAHPDLTFTQLNDDKPLHSSPYQQAGVLER